MSNRINKNQNWRHSLIYICWPIEYSKVTGKFRILNFTRNNYRYFNNLLEVLKFQYRLLERKLCQKK